MVCSVNLHSSCIERLLLMLLELLLYGYPFRILWLHVPNQSKCRGNYMYHLVPLVHSKVGRRNPFLSRRCAPVSQ